MSEYITLTIDGAKIKAQRGALVLDVALEYGICIPHLCHSRDLTPIGVCRLCIVEVIKNGKSKITTSCTLEAEEGMVILAHSEKILKLRKNIAEMLVAEAPNSRSIALQSGHPGHPAQTQSSRLPHRHQQIASPG